MIFKVEGDCLSVIIENNLYSEEIVFKCFYWYTGKFSVEFDKTDHQFTVFLKPKAETTNVDWDEITQKIKQDLIDFKLRSIVHKETNTIRELIVAKAFAYYQEIESPNTEISDPVGFNPEHIKLYE